jgi:hypothetical protein
MNSKALRQLGQCRFALQGGGRHPGLAYRTTIEATSLPERYLRSR